MSNPFDLASQSGVTRVRPNYLAFLCTFRREYGVTDPHRFYQAQRRKVMDRVLPDPYGLARHASLDDWWEAKVMTWKYADLAATITH